MYAIELRVADSSRYGATGMRMAEIERLKKPTQKRSWRARTCPMRARNLLIVRERCERQGRTEKSFAASLP
jgi:hypothetical protein